MAKKLIVTIIALIGIIAMVLPGCGGGGGGGGDTLLLRVATTGILTEPWNPVAGSNWVYDRFVQTATQDMSVVPDPNTGLYIPWRLEKAEVTVNTGLPVGVTSPNDEWLTLNFAATINVPSNAWYDWNATTQTWITAGSNKTAVTKTVAYYNTSIWDVLYHDGSNLTPADFILAAILNFDRAKTDSALYDESYVDAFDAFMSHFKGVTFEFNTGGYGLIVTTYDDTWYLDAEWIVGLDGAGYCWYPLTPYGEFNFETTALGVLAETNSQLAFSSAKATEESCEYMSFIGGPSLNILNGLLNNVTNPANAKYEYIPYAPTLNNTYITGAEALTRYLNVKAFYNSHHHFWVGTGPYYINTVNLSGKVVDLKKFTGYNLAGNLFFGYETPVPTPGYDNVTGGWVDEIVMSVETTGSAAITKLANDELDVYGYGLADPTLLATVQANEELSYYTNIGSYNEYTFNPAANATSPFFSDGRLNPFAVPAIREALNKAIDRTYIGSDIMGGLGTPRYTCIGTADKDAITFNTSLANITSTYAYNFAAANATIYSQMTAISNVTVVGGKYYYNATPVTLIVLIRTEDERHQMGDYLADQLEDLGFTVTRTYGTSGVLSPLWRLSDPDLGLWSAYTGGWVQTQISLDDGSNFGSFYTPLWAAMGILWTHYTPTPEFLGNATALWYNSFLTIPERAALFENAIPQSMADSVRMFLVDRNAFQPLRENVACAADAAGGIYASYLWGATIHFQTDAGVPIAPAT